MLNHALEIRAVVALEMQGNYPEAFEWWTKMLVTSLGSFNL
jgi:hypothetical protein